MQLDFKNKFDDEEKKENKEKKKKKRKRKKEKEMIGEIIFKNKKLFIFSDFFKRTCRESCHQHSFHGLLHDQEFREM